jgi:hypothetical protein
LWDRATANVHCATVRLPGRHPSRRTGYQGKPTVVEVLDCRVRSEQFPEISSGIGPDRHASTFHSSGW